MPLTSERRASQPYGAYPLLYALCTARSAI